MPDGPITAFQCAMKQSVYHEKGRVYVSGVQALARDDYAALARSENWPNNGGLRSVCRGSPKAAGMAIESGTYLEFTDSAALFE